MKFCAYKGLLSEHLSYIFGVCVIISACAPFDKVWTTTSRLLRLELANNLRELHRRLALIRVSTGKD